MPDSTKETADAPPPLYSELVTRLQNHFKAMLKVHDVRSRTGWMHLLQAVPFLEGRQADRLMFCLGKRAAWVLIEDQYIDRDYRDTFSHVFSRRFATPPSRCQRLHFFGPELSNAPDFQSMKDKATGEAYLGYAVVRPTRPNGLGRMLVKPKIALADLQELQLSLCPEKITLFGRRMEIRGFPFISQDTDVTTCAQATLWMLRRYYSNRYSQYAETRPYELATFARQHLRGDRSFPASGLMDWQMAEMLRGLGFSPVVHARKVYAPKDAVPQTETELQQTEADKREEAKKKLEARRKAEAAFHQILHIYLDSGIPLVLSFHPKDPDGVSHATACFGFRNRNRSLHEAGKGGFRAYESGSLLVNDDNFGPYLEVLPEQGDEIQAVYAHAPELSQVSSIVVPLPDGISLLADQFNALVRTLLTDKKYGIGACSPTLNSVENLTLRIYLTTCRNLKQHVPDQRMVEAFVDTAYRLMPLPHYIWVCELHDCSADWKERCLGEILWDATCNEHESQGLLALHYPELLIINSPPVFENRVVSSAKAQDNWLIIPLQTRNPASYSPSSSNLESFELLNQ